MKNRGRANIIEPAFYHQIVQAFERVGAPIFSRVQAILTIQRREVTGDARAVSVETVKKAWERGWDSMHGGLPAPPIKTHFPHWLKPDVPQPVGGHHKAVQEIVYPRPASPPPTPQPVVVSELQDTQPVVGQEAGIGSAPGAVTDLTPPVRVRQPTPSEALARVDAGTAAALLNEMIILGTARKNLSGIGTLLNVLIEKLNVGAEALLGRLASDLEKNEKGTMASFVALLSSVQGLMKDYAATTKLVQEAQRLLAGMPQKITEERRQPDEEREGDETLGRMARMLRTRPDTMRAYGGEETDPPRKAQDVEFTEAAPHSGKEVANGGQAEPNSAATQGTATG